MQRKFLAINLILIIAVALLMPMNSICAAQEFTCVDAEDMTGYYVDTETIKIERSEFITATIAVIRADMNKMYVYNLRINHKDQTYQIISSKILEYDTRRLIESNDRSRPYRPYAARSEMSVLIKYILYGEDFIDN